MVIVDALHRKDILGFSVLVHQRSHESAFSIGSGLYFKRQKLCATALVEVDFSFGLLDLPTVGVTKFNFPRKWSPVVGDFQTHLLCCVVGIKVDGFIKTDTQSREGVKWRNDFPTNRVVDAVVHRFHKADRGTVDFYLYFQL